MNSMQTSFQGYDNQQEQNFQHQIYVIQEKEKKILMILDSLAEEEFQVAISVLDQLKMQKQQLKQQYNQIVNTKQQYQQNIQPIQQQIVQQSQITIQGQNYKQCKPKIVKKIYYIDGQMVKEEDNLNESLHFGIKSQEQEYQKNMKIFSSTSLQKENYPVFTKQKQPQKVNFQNNQQKNNLDIQHKVKKQDSNKQLTLLEQLNQQNINKLQHPKQLTNIQLYDLYRQGGYQSIQHEEQVYESQRDLLEELYIKQVLKNYFPEEKINYGAVNYLKAQDNFTQENFDLLKEKFYSKKENIKKSEQNEKVRDMIDIYQSAQLKLWEKLDEKNDCLNKQQSSLEECRKVMKNNPQDLNPLMINQLFQNNIIQDYFQENMSLFLVEQINYINLKLRLKDYELSQHDIQYEAKQKQSNKDDNTFHVMSEVNLDTKKCGYFQSNQKIPIDLKFNNFDVIEEESIEGQNSKVQEEDNDSMNEEFQNYSYQKNNFQQSHQELKIQNSYSLNQCKTQQSKQDVIVQEDEQKELDLLEEVNNLKLRNSKIKKFKEDYDINVQISLMSQSLNNSNKIQEDNNYLDIDNSGFNNLLSKQNSKNSDQNSIQDEQQQNNIQEEIQQQEDIQDKQNNQVQDLYQKPQKISLKDYMERNFKSQNYQIKNNQPKSTFSFREQMIQNKIQQPQTFSLKTTNNNKDRNKELIEFLKIKIRTLQSQINDMKNDQNNNNIKQIQELELKRSTLDEQVAQISHKNSFEPFNQKRNINNTNNNLIDMRKKNYNHQFENNEPHQVESLKYTLNKNLDNDEFNNNIKNSIQIINNK